MSTTTFVPKTITKPVELKRMTPPILMRLLKKHKSFFGRKKALPQSPAQIEYDRLTIVLQSPSEKMGAALMADLFYWDQLASLADWDQLCEYAEKANIDFPEECTHHDLALILQLEAPAVAVELYTICQAHELLRKRKKFLSYYPIDGVIPRWRKPQQKRLDALAEAMSNWYGDHRKGMGTEIIPFYKKEQNAVWFIVQHGDVYKHVGVYEDSQPSTTFYRPEVNDLLIYLYDEGRLAIYNESNGKNERNKYCLEFGKCIFDDPDMFLTRDRNIYSLEPLRRGRNSLDCEEIPELASARLTSLRYLFGGTNKHKVTHAAEDVFAGLAAQSGNIPGDATLLHMGFKMKFAGSGFERSAKIRYPNVSVYDHEVDHAVVSKLLRANGFLNWPPKDEAKDE